MSARRHGQPIPVEIECSMPPDPLISRARTAPLQGKRKFRQTELDTPPSSSKSPSPIWEEKIELWTPTLQLDTCRVPLVVCNINPLPYTQTELVLD
eukprot:1373331-Rhodomonas_salina.4